jgi:hypothetical protein
MLAVKGIYKDGKIEIIEPIEDVKSADLFIIVVPHESEKKMKRFEASETDYQGRVMDPESDFKMLGLCNFFHTEDDRDVDWEAHFGLKK